MIMKSENSGCLILLLFIFIMMTIGAFAMDMYLGIFFLLICIMLIVAFLGLTGYLIVIKKYLDWFFGKGRFWNK